MCHLLHLKGVACVMPTDTRTPTLRRRRRRDLASVALAATAALAATPFVARMAPLGLSSANAEAAAQLAAVPATSILETAARAVSAGTGRHLGFDTHSYPGDRAMKAWRASDANYEWVGYYLPAPCHRDASWSGTRERLDDMGWGVAVIYVGQQTWTDPGHRSTMSRAELARAERNGATCLPTFVHGERGRAEAEDAVARTAAEGFPAGTVIYLDIERMEIVPPHMRDYYRQWVARVLEDGRFVPGVYVHTHNAKVVYRDVRAQYVAAGIDADPPFWVAGGSGFDRKRAPADVGHTFAHAWQGVLDIVEKRNGFKMPIDVNVASVPSPSGALAMAD